MAIPVKKTDPQMSRNLPARILTGYKVAVYMLLFLISAVSCNRDAESHPTRGTVPIVFHRGYDITLGGIEQFHPFDSVKYGRVFDGLSNHFLFEYDDVYRPVEVTMDELGSVHSEIYLQSLNDDDVVETALEMPGISWLPHFLIERAILRPMRLAAGGTVLAVDVAYKFGWAVNLSGGYHHAKKGGGEGFCVYGDIALAARRFFAKNPVGNVLVVDLDAHQGNGVADMLGDDERVIILDIYNSEVYPDDIEEERFIDYRGAVKSGMRDESYLALVRKLLSRAFAENTISFVIYNAGTDIFEDDPLGGFSVTKKGIIRRDAMVFETARKNNVPIVMLLSGGYTEESAGIITRSLINLIERRGVRSEYEKVRQ